jgi:hypothetical protein
MPKILKWETWGAIFISLFGSLLHFTFNWFNRFWLVGAFSAVNESTWEHLKLAVVPAIIWMLVERKVFKSQANPISEQARYGASNFLLAKTIGIFAMPILIVTIFYSYTAILGDNFLVLDIGTFFLAVIIGQIINYKIMKSSEFSQKYNKICVGLLVILAMAFIVFTYFPPKIFLFHDPVSGEYGIVKNNNPRACTMEAKLCPDGSAVGRTGPNCEFAECPMGSGFVNNQIEKAITNYLLTQTHFSWTIRNGDYNFCAVENLKPEKELFPLYVWAHCGEYIVLNGGLKTISGTSGPTKIDYPNELSFYALNRFSYEAPGDGAQYSEDVKRIFPEDVQQKIFNFDNENIIKRIENIALTNILSWEAIKKAINNCEVKEVFQAHSRDVSAELKNGDKLIAIEPKIDDIIDIAVAAEFKCGRIIMATE